MPVRCVLLNVGISQAGVPVTADHVEAVPWLDIQFITTGTPITIRKNPGAHA